MGRANAKGYVYFVVAREQGMVKIGYSKDAPDARLGMLRIGSPVPLERMAYIRDGQDLERRLHVQFRAVRSHGEWFHLTDELIEYIEDHGVEWRGKSQMNPADRTQRNIERERLRLEESRLEMQKFSQYMSELRPKGTKRL
jgi:hypothetical protein